MPQATTRAGSTPGFALHFDAAARALQRALTELFAVAGADASRPQQVSRRFGVNKNLAWKAAKIVSATDMVSVFPHVPGASGMRILLEAFADHGVDAGTLAAVSAAEADFESMVQEHAGDRSTLELMLASMLPRRVDPERLETSRRLAFQGNSMILGVSSKVRFSLSLLAPSPGADGIIDLASMGGVRGFRRLRPTGSWPLVELWTYGTRSSPIEPMAEGPIRPGEAPLVRRFCSEDLPEIRTVERGEKTLYELGEGPVGDTAKVNCTFGWVHRRFASIYAEDPDEVDPVGEHFLRLDAPVELLHFDLFLHRDLPIEVAPRGFFYGLMQRDVRYPLTKDTRNHLPFPADVVALGLDSSIVASPHIPEYPRMVELACSRLGASLSAFRGYRFMVSYPPIPSFAVLQHPLVVEGNRRGADVLEG